MPSAPCRRTPEWFISFWVLSLKELDQNTSLLWGLHCDSIQKITVWKVKKKGKFPLEKPDLYYLTQVTKLKSIHSNSWWQTDIWNDVRKTAIFLWCLPSPQNITQRNHKKLNNPIEGHCTKCLISILQNCKGHQKRGRSKQLSQPRDASEGKAKFPRLLDGITEQKNNIRWKLRKYESTRTSSVRNFS